VSGVQVQESKNSMINQKSLSDWKKASNFFNNGDFKSALALFMKLADSGEAHAYTEIGNLYELGVEGRVDIEKAIDNYEKAASIADDSIAHVRLGRIYYERGTSYRDSKLALEHFYRAAELDESSGYYALGILYYMDDGIDRDVSAARECLKIAMDKGHLLAKKSYGILLINEGAWFQGFATYLSAMKSIVYLSIVNPKSPVLEDFP